MSFDEKKRYCDEYAWKHCKDSHLWLFDKLLLSRKLGYRCGPAGVDVDQPGEYVVRPCLNVMGMGRGAYVTHLDGSTDHLPEGTFWCEKFEGRHLSIDYEYEKQVLCVEGIRSDDDPLWKWKEWRRTDDEVPYPEFFKRLDLNEYQYLNVEMIDGRIIEVHFRHNPDWRNVAAEVKGLKPCYKKVDGMIEDSDYKRIGFITVWE